jgi:hypothetical protein
VRCEGACHGGRGSGKQGSSTCALDGLQIDGAVRLFGHIAYDVIDRQHRLLVVRLTGERVFGAGRQCEREGGAGHSERCHRERCRRGVCKVSRRVGVTGWAALASEPCVRVCAAVRSSTSTYGIQCSRCGGSRKQAATSRCIKNSAAASRPGRRLSCFGCWTPPRGTRPVFASDLEPRASRSRCPITLP